MAVLRPCQGNKSGDLLLRQIDAAGKRRRLEVVVEA